MVTPPRGGPGGPAAFGRVQRALAEYLQFQYTAGYLKLLAHVRGLPRVDAGVAWLGLGVTALTVVVTPILATVADVLPGVAFEDVQGQMRSVPAVALGMGLAVFCLAWAYLLTGAAAGPGWLWLLAGLQYVYQIVVIGLAARRSWWHLLALALPVAVGALTPTGRPWAKVLLAFLVASVAIRLSPLPASWRSLWYLLWLPAGAAFVGLHAVLARRAWPSALHRLALAGAGTAIYLFVVALLARPRLLAEGFHLALNNSITLLELLWFLLGASFVASAISFGRLAKRLVEHVAPEPIPLWTLLAAWILLIAWLRFPVGADPGPSRTWGIAVLVAVMTGLALRWRRRGMTRAWLAGWFVASVAALGVVRAYFNLDVSDVITREAGTLSLVGFSYAVTWEVAGRIPAVPLSTPRLTRPSPLLLYLGVILLIGAASLFGLAANLKFFQELVVLAEYRGALALGVAVGLRALMEAWPTLFPSGGQRRVVDGFLLSAMLAVVAFPVRAAVGPGLSDAGTVVALLLLGLVLARRWPEMRAPWPAAALGVATALGLAISLSSRVLVALLHPLLTMVAALGGPRELKAVADAIFAWVHQVPWRPLDQVLYYVVAPILAVIVTIAASGGLRRGGGRSMRMPLGIALAAGTVIALVAATGAAQSTDPRGAEIKRRVERFGLKVVEVSFAPAKDAGPAVWVAGTVAKYDQPSWDRVTDQALTVWNVMFAVLKGENPQTILAAPQDWKTYRLFVATPYARIVAFDQGARTAQTDADRQKVFQALYGGIIFRVFDVQQQKFIDDKEFVAKHFAR